MEAPSARSISAPEHAANAQARRDETSGVYTLFVIIGMLAEEKDLRQWGAGARRKFGDLVEQAALAGEFPVWLRSAGRVLDKKPREIGLDHMARIDDVRKWLKAQGIADYPRPGSIATVARERANEMRRDRSSGMTDTAIAEKYKISRARVGQILGSRTSTVVSPNDPFRQAKGRKR